MELRKIKIKKMNKRAYSMGGWVEVALFSTLFVLLIISLVAFMNVNYDQNYDGSFGLSSAISSTQEDLKDYQDTLQEGIREGEASSSGEGISLTTIWNIITSGIDIMWNFLTGGFIEQIVGLMQLPDSVAYILRILYVLSIGFILIKLILKIKP